MPYRTESKLSLPHTNDSPFAQTRHMRQVALLPSGCQVGNANCLVHFTEKRIFYASSLSVYVLSSVNFVVLRVLHHNQKAITSIAVNPLDESILAVGGSDGQLCIWDVENQRLISRLQLTDILCVGWSPKRKFVCGVLQGPSIRMLTWHTEEENCVKELLSVRGETLKSTLFRWSTSCEDLAIACNAGTAIVMREKDRSQIILSVAEKKHRVVDLQWDRLSDNYLLVAYEYNIILWDVDSKSQINVFDKQPAEISGIVWMHWTAGGFLSVNARNHNIKIWNASQANPIDSIRVRISGGIAGVSLCAANQKAVMSCSDGSLHVYDLKHSCIDYSGPAGHTETIFSCKMSPKSPFLFATASYDSTIKIWNADTLKLEKTLNGPSGNIIYCVDWSPSGKYVAASTFSGMVLIWDISTGIELCRYSFHSKPSFSISWSQLNEKYVASSSADGSVCIIELDFEVLIDAINTAKSVSNTAKNSMRGQVLNPAQKRHYKLGSAIFGIQWSPFLERIFGCCSQDGNVYLYDVELGGEAPLLVLSGHSSRVFSCAWSPIDKELLATASDDQSVCVWRIPNIESESNLKFSMKKLIGHKNFVRALCWNYELVDLLLSGSWDASIRLWNACSGQCLLELQDHVADVYSLSSSPFRPTLYISVSRDTTIRFWELQGIFLIMRFQAIWDRGLSRKSSLCSENRLQDLCAVHVKSAVPSLGVGMLGAFSAVLQDQLEGLSESERMYRLFCFFTGSRSYLEIWENVMVHVSKVSQSTRRGGYLRKPENRLIFHESEILPMARSQLITTNKNNRKSSDQHGYLLAAMLADMKLACEKLVEAGNYETAISLAPSVSMDYWKKLVIDHAQLLAQKGKSDCILYFVASGRFDSAVEYCLQRNDAESAYILAKSSLSSVLPIYETCAEGPHSPVRSILVDRVAVFQSRKSFLEGDPICASAHLISIGEIDKALDILINSSEIDLAYAVAMCLGRDTTEIISLWARRCAQLGCLQMAIELLKSLERNETEISLLLSEYCDTETSSKTLRLLNFRSISDWMSRAREEEAIGSDAQAVISYLAAHDHSSAASAFLHAAERFIHLPWSLTPEARSMIIAAKRARAVELPPSIRIRFLCFLLWFSIFEAAASGYFATAAQMLSIFLVHLPRIDFPIPEVTIQIQHVLFSVLARDDNCKSLLDEVSSSMDSSTDFDGLSNFVRNVRRWEDWKQIAITSNFVDSSRCFEDVVRSIVQLTIQCKLPTWTTARNFVKSKEKNDEEFIFSLLSDIGSTMLMGTMIPVANQKLKQYPSVLSGKRIVGPIYYLMDQVVALNELASWIRFFPFSPSMDGEKPIL